MNNEEELKEEYTNTLRCVICDKVNNPSVQNLPGLFHGFHNSNKYFYHDTKHKDAFICLECKMEIEDALEEYKYYDEQVQTPSK